MIHTMEILMNFNKVIASYTIKKNVKNIITILMPKIFKMKKIKVLKMT